MIQCFEYSDTFQPIGETRGRVIRVETVTKDDDTCTQRHERLGTQRVYSYNAGIIVTVHVSDSSFGAMPPSCCMYSMLLCLLSQQHYREAMIKSADWWSWSCDLHG